MAPIASGQYYWVYILAPPGYKKISSYIIGWLTSLAWIATVATESLFAGTIIQGLLVINYPSYTIQRWQGTLLTWLVIVTNVFINCVTPNLLPKFEVLIMVLHLCGFVAIMATLLSTSEIGTSTTVFLTAFNEGGWSTQGLSYCVGFLGNVATFVGADASVHMAEEVENAAIVIPRASKHTYSLSLRIGTLTFSSLCRNDNQWLDRLCYDDYHTLLFRGCRFGSWHKNWISISPDFLQ
jgi:choline transport protein